LFQKAQRRQVQLITSEAVIAEIVYVLSSKEVYNLRREEIRARLYPLLSIPGLKLPHRKMYLQALDLYTQYIVDFADALTIAQMRRAKRQALYSYDRGFDRVAEIKRLEP
jgi:predicted nucleic acid-binding protein